MKNISFLSENYQFLMVKFSIYLNRRVFVMMSIFQNLPLLKFLPSMLSSISISWIPFPQIT